MKNNSQKGFTLIETLVAIAIFAFAITALISITARGVFNTNYVKNRFTASYLAMEGAEFVRNIRDSAVVAGTPDWNGLFASGGVLDACLDTSGSCYINVDSNNSLSVNPCSGSCPAINYDSSTARFGYINGVQSIFTPTITIEDLPSPGVPEVRVTSRVDWNQGTNVYHAEFVYNLSKWSGQ